VTQSVSPQLLANDAWLKLSLFLQNGPAIACYTAEHNKALSRWREGEGETEIIRERGKVDCTVCWLLLTFTWTKLGKLLKLSVYLDWPLVLMSLRICIQKVSQSKFADLRTGPPLLNSCIIIIYKAKLILSALLL
jgi:hypothetical protein